MVPFFLSDNVSKGVNLTPRFVPSINLGWIKEPAPYSKNIVEKQCGSLVWDPLHGNIAMGAR
jgi:hypothetical protein